MVQICTIIYNTSTALQDADTQQQTGQRQHSMKQIKTRLRGGGTLPAQPQRHQLLLGLLGSFLSILLLQWLSNYTSDNWLIAPFGATCVLLFASPQSPFAQPRNVIAGHLIAAIIGLLCIQLLGHTALTMALAVSLSIVLMQAWRAVHPPAGATALLLTLTTPGTVGYEFILTPVLSGSMALVLIAAVCNNLSSQQKWPLYWFGRKAAAPVKTDN